MLAHVLVSRLTGAALTIGGIALATFINFEIPEKTFLHLVVMAAAVIISVTGIGIYEDAGGNEQRDAPPTVNDATAPSSLHARL